jgi:hypothetical protein
MAWTETTRRNYVRQTLLDMQAMLRIANGILLRRSCLLHGVWAGLARPICARL